MGTPTQTSWPLFPTLVATATLTLLTPVIPVTLPVPLPAMAMAMDMVTLGLVTELMDRHSRRSRRFERPRRRLSRTPRPSAASLSRLRRSSTRSTWALRRRPSKTPSPRKRNFTRKSVSWSRSSEGTLTPSEAPMATDAPGTRERTVPDIPPTVLDMVVVMVTLLHADMELGMADTGLDTAILTGIKSPVTFAQELTERVLLLV